jgi:osmotically-inducible protein OsmY
MGTFSKKVGATLLASILFQSKLATDPVAKGSAVSVTAKDGKVTLKGTVRPRHATKNGTDRARRAGSQRSDR